MTWAAATNTSFTRVNWKFLYEISLPHKERKNRILKSASSLSLSQTSSRFPVWGHKLQPLSWLTHQMTADWGRIIHSALLIHSENTCSQRETLLYFSCVYSLDFSMPSEVSVSIYPTDFSSDYNPEWRSTHEASKFQCACCEKLDITNEASNFPYLLRLCFVLFSNLPFCKSTSSEL